MRNNLSKELGTKFVFIKLFYSFVNNMKQLLKAQKNALSGYNVPSEHTLFNC